MQGNTSTYRPAAGVARAGVAGLLAVRLAIGIAIAFVVTFGLYYGMHVLITGSGKPPTEDNSFKIVDTRVPPEETEVQRKDRKPPKPKPPEEPPEPPKFDNVVSNKPNASATNMNFDFGANANISGGISFDAAQDRDVLPIVRVEPIYPQRAASRGIEGYVILEFTVLPSGEVDAESIQI
ncbi:MAG: TonB family protein, partial [Alphaproteobacteria bacterium]